MNGPNGSTPRAAVTDKREAIFETLFKRGRVEDDELNLLPEIALVLPADDADGPLELLAAKPKLAVERHIGQTGDEPLGSVIEISLT